ncbi:bifunctional hydroxymethylpyrimidine kinase/phosphomethylpyrimidine kinase [Ferviditalea candida]|uniref:Hydroxymethylpyrimidine/phosphomethylpyrimidine kinase n=1 Tax=Ferviditalea candida TaxID=3108399 RepID=A0ABU5ZL04_9BACL|nr:bifunctional hydroxymethylpyrimidine kinase/phosphomethylpyrimidine kinase [Paenibacillaceae bacterium T2]
MSIRKALTIAGSDSGGGAGIQADLKTFQELGVYGMSVITAVTAQNTLGVQAVYPLGAEAVIRQMDSIAADLAPDAVKTGMLVDRELMETTAEQIRKHGWRNLVVDPVMSAKGGVLLLHKEAVEAMKLRLLPLAEVVTPNIPEAEILSGLPIVSEEQRKEAARKIHACGSKYVVIKGGHGNEPDLATDLIYDGERFTELSGRRVATRHSHGTGCTFAAAIAAGLAQGIGVLQAVQTAKQFIQAALEEELGIGGGHGPTNHWAFRRRLLKNPPGADSGREGGIWK